jgi:hypothetical protein
MNDKVEFSNRLKLALVNAGYKARPTDLEKGFNSRYWGRSVSVQAVAKWLKGVAIPSHEKILVLSEWLKIDPQELRYGAEASKAINSKKKLWDENIEFIERETIDCYLSLPSKERKIAREVINSLFISSKISSDESKS